MSIAAHIAGTRLVALRQTAAAVILIASDARRTLLRPTDSRKTILAEV